MARAYGRCILRERGFFFISWAVLWCEEFLVNVDVYFLCMGGIGGTILKNKKKPYSTVKGKVTPAGESLMCSMYSTILYGGERAPGEEVSYPCQAHMTKLSQLQRVQILPPQYAPSPRSLFFFF